MGEQPKYCKCCGRLLLVHVAQEGCDLKMGNYFFLNCPQSRHLSDETGVGKANEKGYKDN